METKVIVDFYKQLVYIFGICPCCNEILHIPEANLSLPTKKVILSESKRIIELQNQNENKRERIESIDEAVDYNNYEISELKLELKSKDNQEIIKVKKDGRRQAIDSTKKVVPIFGKKKFDPRDARLIFSPVEFLIFEGLTEYKEVDKLILLSRKPETSEQEKIGRSIADTIAKGNLDFKVIRFSNNGQILS